MKKLTQCLLSTLLIPLTALSPADTNNDNPANRIMSEVKEVQRTERRYVTVQHEIEQYQETLYRISATHIKVRNIETNELLYEKIIESRFPHNCLLIPNIDLIAISNHFQLCLYDFTNQDPLCTASGPMSSMAVDPQGRCLLFTEEHSSEYKPYIVFSCLRFDDYPEGLRCLSYSVNCVVLCERPAITCGDTDITFQYQTTKKNTGYVRYSLSTSIWEEFLEEN